MSLPGITALVQSVLSQLGLNYQLPVGEVEFQKKSGDLGSKILNGNTIAEELTLIENEAILQLEESLELVEKFDPTTGHSGSLRKWVNNNAPIRKSIVVMGNSVSERGASCFGLTWWFARMFQNSLFCWSSALLPEIIEKEKPDYVICQTVERFLPTLPKS